MLQNFYINTMPTLLLARFFDKALRQSQAPVLATVSAKVGSIEDDHLVTALHPGTSDTQLSKPFQARVPPAMLFQPATTATALVDLMLQLEPAQNGKFLAWDGNEIPR